MKVSHYASGKLLNWFDLSNQEIAEALKLSRRTIECHRQVAYKKLQVNNVKELKLILEEGKQ